MAKKIRKLNGFFYIDSIPGVMFTYGITPYEQCKQYNGALTKKEYELALRDCEERQKKHVESKKALRPKVQKVKDGKKVASQ